MHFHKASLWVFVLATEPLLTPPPNSSVPTEIFNLVYLPPELLCHLCLVFPCNWKFPLGLEDCRFPYSSSTHPSFCLIRLLASHFLIPNPCLCLNLPASRNSLYTFLKHVSLYPHFLKLSTSSVLYLVPGFHVYLEWTYKRLEDRIHIWERTCDICLYGPGWHHLIIFSSSIHLPSSTWFLF